MAASAGSYVLPAGAGSFSLTVEGQGLFIEAQGRPAFALLNSVRAAAPGRFDGLSRRMDAIIAANMKGDFRPLSKAYGGEVAPELLKARWAEMMAESEKARGRVLRFEVLGTARTEDRDETVVRFFFEKGTVDLTYVWDIGKDDRLLGRSSRGLTVKLRLYPSSERDFFTWDGGIRPPKKVRIEPGPDGKLRLTLEGAADSAVR
jgi:hypothetical protein